jgi:hypothetical protein
VTSILSHIVIFARHWVGLARGFAFLAAFALGLWGWYLVHQPADWTGWSNNLFSTAQLLTLQFPDNIAPLPWQLNAARFLVPAIALFESYHLVLRAVRSPARLALLGLRRGHVIVVPGRGSTGLAMLREIRLHAVRAVAIAPDLTPMDQARMEEYRLPILSIDPYSRASWHAARADRASLIVVSHGDDVETLNIIVTVAEALGPRRDRAGPMLLAGLENEALAEQVDVAMDHAARRSGLRYRRLSVADEAARMVFLDPPLPDRKPDRAVPSHVIVVGLGAAARAVLRRALTLGQDAGIAGPTITILAAESELAAEPSSRPGVIPPYVATFRTLACDLSAGVPEAALAALLADAPPPILVCVCLADEAAVSMGLALSRQTNTRQWPDFTIAVHQSREDHFLGLLAREKTAGHHARLRPFGGILPAGTLRRLQDESDDRLPRALHEHYLSMLTRLGGGGGSPVRWDELPENIRHANRAAADHIGVKLAAIGCQVVDGVASDFAFSDDEIDMLASIEHRRWSAERLLLGWRRGARDDEQRLHPDLVPFDALNEEGREKDRDAVRAIPDVLCLAGRSIHRAVSI